MERKILIIGGVAGGASDFLGLSFYEYFNDKRLGRDSIVTEYNFR